MTQPNFFIIGAPKSGTSALHAYLHEHPNIFMPYPGEFQYFAFDLPHMDFVGTYEEYLKCFENCAPEHLAVGEKSVWYLYSSVALEKIKEYDANAKLILMLRNPIDLVYSLHGQLIWNQTEFDNSFEEAWDLQPSRKEGKNIPKLKHWESPSPRLLLYKEVGELGKQVEKLFKIFPRRQVKWILYDDFRDDAKKVYEEVLSFLGVPLDHKERFEKINENKRHRLAWLAPYLWVKIPAPLVTMMKGFKKLLKIRRLGILDQLRKANTHVKPRPPLSAEMRKKLALEFKDDIDRLSRILGRDLSHWYQNDLNR